MPCFHPRNPKLMMRPDRPSLRTEKDSSDSFAEKVPILLGKTVLMGFSFAVSMAKRNDPSPEVENICDACRMLYRQVILLQR
jgi:hypothetical protein